MTLSVNVWKIMCFIPITICTDTKCYMHLWGLMMVINQVIIIAYVTDMFFHVLIV